MTRSRQLFLLSWCCCLLPSTARADGIDVPLVVAHGIGIFVPLLLFNATIETPIMGRFLGRKFSELWPSWFKANVWSLLAGIPALMLNEALTGWFLPGELGQRHRAYPFFLVLFILVFFAATCLAEFLYARRIVRKTGVSIQRGRLVKGVLLANLASYVVLGPVYFFIEYPQTDIHEFASGTSWVVEPAVTVVSIGLGRRLQAASADGRNHRVVGPGGVRDYVVSADLAQVLYRGVDDRFFLFKNGTNLPVPELGFRCLAPEMDFSPTGKYAAFFNGETHQIRVFDFAAGRFREVPTFGEGSDADLVWSSREDTLYLKSNKDYWEIVLDADVTYRHLTSSPGNFANHYGRMGNTRSRDDVLYWEDQEGTLTLTVQPWRGRLVIYNQRETVLTLEDPAHQLGIEQAVFLGTDGDVLVGVGNFVYVLDVESKRIGPVMDGGDFIALARPFSKQVNF